MIQLANLPQIITAIGALGTASFGLVDATKAFWGGVNRIGFGGITKTIKAFTPSAAGAINALPQNQILCTLKANWYNGTDLGSQKAIAKSLIKLFLNPANAPTLAAEAGVDPVVLAAVATSVAGGIALTAPQTDVYSRFDLILTARLDETFQQADQIYRNGTRFCAVIFSLILSVVACYMLLGPGTQPNKHQLGLAFLVGLLAAPLAPIAKDISTALATAVNALQLVKK